MIWVVFALCVVNTVGLIILCLIMTGIGADLDALPYRFPTEFWNAIREAQEVVRDLKATDRTLSDFVKWAGKDDKKQAKKVLRSHRLTRRDG